MRNSRSVLRSNVSIGFPKGPDGKNLGNFDIKYKTLITMNQKKILFYNVLFSIDTQAAEKRLRDRWKAFLAEATKEISFDHKLSSPTIVTAITNRDLIITCATNRPLRGQYRLSFIRLKDFSLLFVGERRHMR